MRKGSRHNKRNHQTPDMCNVTNQTHTYQSFLQADSIHRQTHQRLFPDVGFLPK